jgi:hypothetical protein
MAKKSVVIDISVGRKIVFRARFHAANGTTLVDASLPHDPDLQRECAALLIMGAYEMVGDTERRQKVIELLALLGEDMSEKPETLTAEQFRAKLGGNSQSVPDDLPF